MANISKLFDELDIDEELEAQTVNGWTMTELGKLPAVGDVFENYGLKVSVLTMDGKRIENVHITDMRENDDNSDNKDSDEDED